MENEGKGRSACVLGVEAGVVVGDVEADEENREDTGRALAICCRQQRQLEVVLEEENSPKDILHHLGHGLCRVLGLAGGNGDGFGTTIWEILSVGCTDLTQSSCALTGERSSDKDRGKAADATNKRSSRDMPIFTTNVMALSIATAVDNDAHDNEDHNGDDFQQTQPVFELLKSVRFNP